MANPSNFTDNLQDYLQNFYSPAPDQNSDHEEFQTSTQFKTSDEIGLSSKPDELNSKNVSFAGGSSLLNPNNTTTAHQPGKEKPVRIKINPLKLPIFNEDGFRIISRSSRRNDQPQAMSHNSVSNRNPIGNAPGTISVDSSAKGPRRHSHQYSEAGMSHLDENESLIFEKNVVPDFCKKYKSASDTMRSLARKMGEYFLSIDLGCLLEQKRKQQMDDVAKFSGQEDGELKDIESILYNSRIKTEEKNLKKEVWGCAGGIMATPSCDGKDSMGPDCHPSINIGAPEQVDLISHSMIKSSNRRQYDELECLQTSGLKFLDQKTGVRKISKVYAKICKLLLNIGYILLRDVDYDKLQQFLPFLNIIYLYFTTTVSIKAREQELLLEAAKFSFWREGFDHNVHDLSKVCEGIEKTPNLDNFSHQYERQRLNLKLSKNQWGKASTCAYEHPQNYFEKTPKHDKSDISFTGHAPKEYK